MLQGLPHANRRLQSSRHQRALSAPRTCRPKACLWQHQPTQLRLQPFRSANRIPAVSWRNPKCFMIFCWCQCEIPIFYGEVLCFAGSIPSIGLLNPHELPLASHLPGLPVDTRAQSSRPRRLAVALAWPSGNGKTHQHELGKSSRNWGTWRV